MSRFAPVRARYRPVVPGSVVRTQTVETPAFEVTICALFRKDESIYTGLAFYEKTTKPTLHLSEQALSVPALFGAGSTPFRVPNDRVLCLFQTIRRCS